MTRSTILAVPFAAVIALGGCGQDVVINVDELPQGNATGTAGSGVFTYSQVVEDSSCPDTYEGLDLSPDAWEITGQTIEVEQDEGYFKLDFEDYFFDGGIFWYGNFRVGGTYRLRESGSGHTAIKAVNLVDGRFVDGVDDMKGTIQVRLMEEGTEEGLDCDVTVKFFATRE
jgi:hypothetical protein